MLISNFEQGSGIVLVVWRSQRANWYWWYAIRWDNDNGGFEMANTWVLYVAYLTTVCVPALFMTNDCWFFAPGLSLWKIKATPCDAARVLMHANMWEMYHREGYSAKKQREREREMSERGSLDFFSAKFASPQMQHLSRVQAGRPSKALRSHLKRRSKWPKGRK